ncbi:MAG: YegS/Rv2252/BmrU family lipid kinase [Bacteroidota bacterium]
MKTTVVQSKRKRIWFIVNPFSGVKRKINFPKLIDQHLDQSIYDYQLFYTDHAGHATKLAEKAVREGVEVVVAVGGDGSVNEVAAALIGTDTTLGILPSGSGNGFAMHLGLGRNVEKAIEFLNQGNVVRVDSCLLNDRTFVNLAGVGFDAMVAYQLKKSSFRGFMAYLYHSIRTAWKYRPGKYTIHFDGKQVERECLLVEVANSAMFGYNFQIAPQAKLTDGLLEIIVVKKAPIWRYLLSLWRFMNNSFHKSALAECYQAEKIQIVAEDEAYVHIDGEGFLSCHNLNFSINKLSLQVLVPKTSQNL